MYIVCAVMMAESSLAKLSGELSVLGGGGRGLSWIGCGAVWPPVGLARSCLECSLSSAYASPQQLLVW